MHSDGNAAPRFVVSVTPETIPSGRSSLDPFAVSSKAFCMSSILKYCWRCEIATLVCVVSCMMGCGSNSVSQAEIREADEVPAGAKVPQPAKKALPNRENPVAVGN